MLLEDGRIGALIWRMPDYLDAEEIGRMTAAWVAVEDIAPDAGRFFVYPKSHLSRRLEIGRLRAEDAVLSVLCSAGDSVPLIGLTCPR